MKRLGGILFLVLAISCGKREIEHRDPPSGNMISVLPADGDVPQVHISVSDAQWETLLEAYNQNNQTQEYIHCDITYADANGSQTVRDAGLRLKGNTSRRYPGGAGNMHHVHFGLNLSEYQAGGTLLGTSRLDLKWFKDDPAYCREVFCYDLFRRFGVWTALSTGYVRLWVKVGKEETYMGVYQLMEHIRGDYLRRRSQEFGGSEGHLWKANWGASFRSSSAKMGVDDNQHSYVYELKSAPDDFFDAQLELQNFISSLVRLSGEEFYSWAQEAMDVELLLKTYAVNVAVGMWDDYWNNTNNFYFYFNPSGKFFFIPYDYDNTLGTTKNLGVQSDAGRQNPLKWGSSDNPLITKLLGKAEWKALYISYLKELCAGDFSADAAIARIRAWQEAIEPYVSNDTGEDMSIEDKPASWSNHREYRLLQRGSNNFFEVKASVVNAL